MKGVIFKILEQFVHDTFGPEFFEEVLDETSLETTPPFLGPGTYPDQDLIALVGTTIAKAGLELEDALFAVGKYAFPKLADSFPGITDQHADARSLVRSVHSVIHVEVRKLFPEASPPDFEYGEAPDGRLELTYRSSRKLCWFLRGLLAGCAEHYESEVHVEESRCMHHGHDECCLRIEFVAQGDRVAA